MVGNSNCRMVSGSTYHPTGRPSRAFATYHDGMSKGAAPGVMGGLIQGWPAMAPACHRRRASLREFTCGDGRRRSVRIGLPLFAQESQREILPILTPLPRYPALPQFPGLWDMLCSNVFEPLWAFVKSLFGFENAVEDSLPLNQAERNPDESMEEAVSSLLD